MVTISWHIANLERETSDGYVYTAHWTVSATDGEYSSSSYGSVGFQRPDEELIPFEELTEELVISWVQEKLGEEQVSLITSSLISQIDDQREPSSLSGVPW